MIPFLDLRLQHAPLSRELTAAVSGVVLSGQYIQGAQGVAFEERFAAFCGTGEAIGLSSGTAALHLALLAAGVGPGDEVVTVGLTFVATVAAILYTGATPRLVDVDERRWTMDPQALAAAIGPRTKAVIPVHLHGRLAEMDPILRIARACGVAVIEDAAQAHGACRDGVRAGAFGDIGCFSFFPSKNLGACGEGGAVVTSRAEVAAAVRSLRDWGQAKKYEHVLQGYNYRLDEIQAAVLRVKLDYLDTWTEARIALAARYHYNLAGSSIGLPAPAEHGEHVYHVFAVRVADRDRVRECLAEQGIQTGIHYSRPVHLQPAYAGVGAGPGSLPVTERLADEFLSLPIFPGMTMAQVDEVCDRLLAIAGGRITGGREVPDVIAA